MAARPSLLPCHDGFHWKLAASVITDCDGSLDELTREFKVDATLVLRHSLMFGWHGQAKRRHAIVASPCRRLRLWHATPLAE